MTKFNTLPHLSNQLRRLAADSGFHYSMDVEIPEGWETSSLVMEGILTELDGKEVCEFFTPRQLAVLRPYLLDVDSATPIADALFDSPELCMVIYNGRPLFKEGFRHSCKYINEYAECAFEGVIAEAIGLC